MPGAMPMDFPNVQPNPVYQPRFGSYESNFVFRYNNRIRMDYNAQYALIGTLFGRIIYGQRR